MKNIMEDVLLYFACKYYGDWERIYKALEDKENIDFDNLKEYKQKYQNMYTTIISNDYPANLKDINKPPFVLFYKGNINLINKKNIIWYYGSYYSYDFKNIIGECKKDFVTNDIVLVTGVTNQFEKYFVKNHSFKQTIFVKDEGINSILTINAEKENKILKENLIVSEYPDKVIPSLYTWSFSNRIKIGLTDGIFLINSLKEKTTFKLISDVINENREVFCYNKDIDNKTHNLILINKGACAINEIKELKL